MQYILFECPLIILAVISIVAHHAQASCVCAYESHHKTVLRITCNMVCEDFESEIFVLCTQDYLLLWLPDGDLANLVAGYGQQA